MCAGVPAGAEAGVHAVRETFEEDSNEAVLLIDGESVMPRQSTVLEDGGDGELGEGEDGGPMNDV